MIGLAPVDIHTCIVYYHSSDRLHHHHHQCFKEASLTVKLTSSITRHV